MQQATLEYARLLEFHKEIQNLAGVAATRDTISATTYSVHRQVLPYVLTFGIDIGIFLAIYQYRKYAIFFHAIVASACMMVTLVTSLQILIPSQISNEKYWQKHAIIGIVIIIAITVQMVCGIIAKVLPCLRDRSSSNTIYIITRIHIALGYLLIILCKVQTYMALDHAGENHKFWVLLAVDAVLCLLFVVRKMTMKKMQYLSIPQRENEQMVRQIQKLEDLGKEEGKLFGIFANYVYNIEPLTRFHPLGFKIIQTVRGREFDRYLFGSAATERLPNITPNPHSLKSIELLGSPIAKLKIPTVYEGLEEDMQEVRLLQMVEISQKGHMYEVRLMPTTGKGFKYNGYSSVYQIGRYFVLNLDNKFSRLYITVSFLAPKNLEILEELYFRPNNQIIYSPKMNAFNYMNSDSGFGMINTERRLEMMERVEYLPLFIKKYPGGCLTAPLIEQRFAKLQLSTQRGRGLQLYNLTPGKVVIFIGGTGIIPFGDLIDLLFKAILVQTKPECKDIILAHNPILATKSFEGFSFKFYLEQHSYEDIHPLTRAQLIEVSKYPELLEFHLKCHDKIEDIRLKRSRIKIINEGIEECVKKELNEDSYENIAQYWVCCSPTVNEKLMKIFDSRHIPQQKFVFL